MIVTDSTLFSLRLKISNNQNHNKTAFMLIYKETINTVIFMSTFFIKL